MAQTQHLKQMIDASIPAPKENVKEKSIKNLLLFFNQVILFLYFY